MKIYNYHPITKYFIQEDLADESPLEPGSFLVPANSTTTPIPEGADYSTICFNGTGWEVVEPVAPKEEVLSTDDIIKSIKATRNSLLASCDFVLLPDSPFTKSQVAEWKIYRQALRDLTKQEGFPLVTVWPEEPIFNSKKTKDTSSEPSTTE